MIQEGIELFIGDYVIITKTVVKFIHQDKEPSTITRILETPQKVVDICDEVFYTDIDGVQVKWYKTEIKKIVNITDHPEYFL